jgi:hypothetical protein
MIKDMRILLLTCYFNNLRSNIAAFDASGGFLECHLSPFPFYRREKLFGRPPQRRFPRCEVPDDPNTRYGKLLTRLTGPKKTREMAHNTGFLRMARPGSGSRGLPFGGENVGAAGSESPFVSSGQAFG